MARATPGLPAVVLAVLATTVSAPLIAQTGPDVMPIGDWVQDLGHWAFVVAPLAMIVVAILPIPAEIPAAANGVVFGPVVGTVITWVGAVVGAMVSFELARRFGRPLGERLAGTDRVRKADAVVAAAGWPALVTLRLVPVVAFTALNWASGLTAMPRWRFLWTTMVGIVPGAVVFTWSGTGLAALYRVNPTATTGLIGAVVVVSAWTWARYRSRVAPET